MLETSFRSFDYYSGPVPLAQFNIGGNTTDYVDTWLWYTDIDQGCI